MAIKGPDKNRQAPPPSPKVEAPKAKPQSQVSKKSVESKKAQAEVQKNKFEESSKFNFGELSHTKSKSLTGNGYSLKTSEKGTLTSKSKSAEVQIGDKKAQVSHSQNRLFSSMTKTDVSTSAKNGNVTTDQSASFVNGKLRGTSTKETTQDGDLTSSKQVDRNFRRNGKVLSESVTNSVEQKFGDNLSFSRSETKQGGHTSTTTGAKYENGGLKMETSRKEFEGGKVDRESFNGMKKGEYKGAKWEGGKFASERGIKAENKSGHETKSSIEFDRKHEQRNTEEDKARVADRNERKTKMANAQKNLNVAAQFGPSKTLSESKVEKEFGKAALSEGSNKYTTKGGSEVETKHFVGARSTGQADHKVTVDASGVKARGAARVDAGLYAETEGKIDGKYGTAEGKASAKAEVYAEAQGTASIGLDGVKAEGGAKVGAEVSVEVEGKYQTPSVTVGGVELNANVEAKGKLSAQAEAEATGRFQITGNPPTAVVEGEVGASAVLKAEAEGKIGAGPFALTGSAYASAGAEARAHGSIGYDDGKLRLSFGAGAALGVGAGANVGIEVDVKQIGDVAKGVVTDAAEAVHDGLDVNNDGKLGLDDAAVVADRAIETVSNVADAAVDTVSNVADAAVDTVSNVASNVSSGAKKAWNYVTSW